MGNEFYILGIDTPLTGNCGSYRDVEGTGQQENLADISIFYDKTGKSSGVSEIDNQNKNDFGLFSREINTVTEYLNSDTLPYLIAKPEGLYPKDAVISKNE